MPTGCGAGRVALPGLPRVRDRAHLAAGGTPLGSRACLSGTFSQGFMPAPGGDEPFSTFKVRKHKVAQFLPFETS